MQVIHYVQLALAEGIGPILARRAIDRLGSAQAVCQASAAELLAVEGIGQSKSQKLRDAIAAARPAAEAELGRAQEAGVQVICVDDPLYPLLLRNIPDPPLVLYVKGTLEPRDLNAMAIVGSRRCTYYGREQAERFAALLAGAGFTVASGGARGVDSSAHRGALSHPQGRTIAVLGSGIDVVYPPENRDLFGVIAQKGAVISEYPMGTPPLADNFPRRNRIISGLSRGVLVVEADVRSGALVTARQAADDHNRPVFAIPGKIDNPLSAGPHKLIRDGAVLTTALEDILENLGPLPSQAVEAGLFDTVTLLPDNLPAPSPAPRPTVSLSSRQTTIIDAMGDGQVHVDQLIERTGLAAHEITGELTLLSLKGQIKRVDGQTFVRRGSL